MNMTEQDLASLLARNPGLRIQDARRQAAKPANAQILRPKFDSKAEERFYNKRVLPVMIAGFLLRYELHKTFEVVEAVEHCGKKYKNRVYTPDFVLEYKDGSTEVLEVKGRKIKKLQRDYPLRRQLFIIKYCIPNHWRFLEVHDDEI